MGTHCLIFFKETKKDKSFACIYRQFDGYPGGNGIDLAKFLEDKKITNGFNSEQEKAGNYANGMGCLSAQVVKHLKERIGNIYLQFPDENEKESFVYTVYGEGEKIIIEVKDCYDTKKNFKGTPAEFLKRFNERSFSI